MNDLLDVLWAYDCNPLPEKRHFEHSFPILMEDWFRIYGVLERTDLSIASLSKSLIPENRTNMTDERKWPSCGYNVRRCVLWDISVNIVGIHLKIITSCLGLK